MDDRQMQFVNNWHLNVVEVDEDFVDDHAGDCLHQRKKRMIEALYCCLVPGRASSKVRKGLGLCREQVVGALYQ